jgi:hypothetical protein
LYSQNRSISSPSAIDPKLERRRVRGITAPAQ